MKILQRLLAATLGLAIFAGTMPQDALARPLGSGFGFQEDYAPLSDSDLDALVAPIALYPDALVAQVLGAATFPDQVVDANNFLKANPSLKGESLQRAVEGKSWDPPVQALTQFPSVLNTLASNITWTSALGDASATQQEATLAAVQRMRAKGLCGRKSEDRQRNQGGSGEPASHRYSAGESAGRLRSVLQPDRRVWRSRYNSRLQYRKPSWRLPLSRLALAWRWVPQCTILLRLQLLGMGHELGCEDYLLRRQLLLRQSLLERRLLSRLLPGISASLLPAATTTLSGLSSALLSARRSASFLQAAG